MAPTLDDVASIKDLINQLQTRVEQMERSIRNGGQVTPAEQLRMILMGPPGAGKKRNPSLSPSHHPLRAPPLHRSIWIIVIDGLWDRWLISWIDNYRQGNTGPQHQRQVLHLSPGTFNNRLNYESCRKRFPGYSRRACIAGYRRYAPIPGR